MKQADMLSARIKTALRQRAEADAALSRAQQTGAGGRFGCIALRMLIGSKFGKGRDAREYSILCRGRSERKHSRDAAKAAERRSSAALPPSDRFNSVLFQLWPVGAAAGTAPSRTLEACARHCRICWIGYCRAGRRHPRDRGPCQTRTQPSHLASLHFCRDSRRGGPTSPISIRIPGSSMRGG